MDEKKFNVNTDVTKTPMGPETKNVASMDEARKVLSGGGTAVFGNNSMTDFGQYRRTVDQETGTVNWTKILRDPNGTEIGYENADEPPSARMAKMMGNGTWNPRLSMEENFKRQEDADATGEAIQSIYRNKQEAQRGKAESQLLFGETASALLRDQLGSKELGTLDPKTNTYHRTQVFNAEDLSGINKRLGKLGRTHKLNQIAIDVEVDENGEVKYDKINGQDVPRVKFLYGYDKDGTKSRMPLSLGDVQKMMVDAQLKIEGFKPKGKGSTRDVVGSDILQKFNGYNPGNLETRGENDKSHLLDKQNAAALSQAQLKHQQDLEMQGLKNDAASAAQDKDIQARKEIQKMEFEGRENLAKMDQGFREREAEFARKDARLSSIYKGATSAITNLQDSYAKTLKDLQAKGIEEMPESMKKFYDDGMKTLVKQAEYAYNSLTSQKNDNDEGTGGASSEEGKTDESGNMMINGSWRKPFEEFTDDSGQKVVFVGNAGMKVTGGKPLITVEEFQKLRNSGAL